MTGKGEKEALTARQRGGYTREGKSGAQSIPEIIVAEAAADSSEEEGIKKLPCGRENDERGRLPVNGWHHRQALVTPRIPINRNKIIIIIIDM